MCIILATTSHPNYPLILLSNRDEVLARQTSPAAWWPAPHTHILSGRDLQSPAHGTWLGITRAGRLAALTNFRDPHAPDDAAVDEHVASVELRSRGEIVNAFLTMDDAGDAGADVVADAGQGKDKDKDEAAAARFLAATQPAFPRVGGFSCVFGWVRPRARGGPRLGVVSNRTRGASGVKWVTGEGVQGEGDNEKEKQTWGLSNSYFGDRGWPKVVAGEEMLRRAVAAAVEGEAEADNQGNVNGTKNSASTSHAKESEDRLIASLFAVLGVDTLPRRGADEPWEQYAAQLRHSVFIPPVGNEEAARQTPAGGTYGTQKQTVVLVDNGGRVRFTEKTLFDDDARPVGDGEGGVRGFEFWIEGWDGGESKW